jgi:hypothetical protein
VATAVMTMTLMPVATVVMTMAMVAMTAPRAVRTLL